MNFSAVLAELNQASAFGLFRLRVAYQFLHRVVDSIPGTVVDLPAPATLLAAAKS